eukprot:CAMPEP_0184479100 /NCGR_PEP_ID=MMETSP0113_2-20130426/951_1 /TAXON_ID=91329 /ORGANISM="Norrisiella sphaerica, Strain BC52" /LENGTH=126 /DNA_ID=CAMNT_0026857105 /DNA_START=71 /DNA_END=451 /DNA_ORIENTATION=+
MAESVMHGAKLGTFWGIAETIEYWSEDKVRTLKQAGVRVAKTGLTFAIYMAAFSGTTCLSRLVRNKDDFVNYSVGGLSIVGVAYLHEAMAVNQFMNTAKNAALLGVAGSMAYTTLSGLVNTDMKTK